MRRPVAIRLASLASRTALAALAPALALALAACSRRAPATLDELLAAHEATEPAAEIALRLTYDVASRGGAVRMVTSIRRHPFGYREEIAGPHGAVSARVSDGRHAWIWRPDGRGVGLRGNEARNLLLRAFVEGRLYLERDRIAGRAGLRQPAALAPLADLPDGVARTAHVLRADFQTAAAVTARLEFDAADHRLLGYHEPHLDRGSFTRYGVFEHHGELLLPALRASGSRAAGIGLTARLVAVDVDPPLDDNLFAGNPFAEPGGDGGPLVVARGTRPGFAHLLLPEVLIDGRPAGPAVVDTGASVSAADPSLVRRLGLPAGGESVAVTLTGTAALERCWVDAMAWGDRRAGQVTLNALALPALEHLPLALRGAVVLGGDELFLHGPVFDLEAGVLRYRSRPVVPLGLGKDAARVVEVSARSRPGGPTLRVPVHLRGASLEALLDTGFGGMLHLTRRGLTAAGLPVDAAAWITRGAYGRDAAGAGEGSQRVVIAPIPSFRVGSLEFQDAWVEVETEEQADDRRTFDALVGTGAVALFPRVGIDTDRQVVEFEVPPDWPVREDGTTVVPSPGSFVGFFLEPTDASTPPRVRDVMPGSTAHRAGLRDGDRLTAVDGEPCTSRDLLLVQQTLWLQPGQRVVLSFVSPAGKPKRVELP